MKNSILKKVFSVVMAFCMVLPLCGVTAFAAETEPDANDAIIIGEFDGLLSECLDSDVVLPRAVANVRVRSYATYDKEDGVQVTVKLYVPWYSFPKPKFTAMSGTVTVKMNNKTTNKLFVETADEESTISSDVDTGVTGSSGNTGTITVSGVATATNALAGGGVFSISYEIKIP